MNYKNNAVNVAFLEVCLVFIVMNNTVMRDYCS